MNKFVYYPEILVKNDKEYKVVSVDIQKRGDCIAPPWYSFHARKSLIAFELGSTRLRNFLNLIIPNLNPGDIVSQTIA